MYSSSTSLATAALSSWTGNRLMYICFSLPCSALGVFLLWSVSLQLLLALHQYITQRRLDLAQWGVDSLLLTTNNTGQQRY